MKRRWFRLTIGTLVGTVALVTVGIVVKVSVPISIGGIHFGGQQTFINLNGNNVTVDKIMVGDPRDLAPESQAVMAATAEPIVENGGFEYGVEGWGTGWFEDHLIHSGILALSFGRARARWSPDDRNAHSGKSALRVEHLTPYSPN